MNVIENPEEMRAFVRENRRAGRSTGFVPTMGALHDGHASLIERAALDNDLTVVSIFVNPTQFAPGEDFAAYPRTPEEDQEVAGSAGAHVIFTPTPEVIYSPNAMTSVFVGGLSDALCGISRGSSHFRGVCTIVTKLFNIVQPDRAYFGLKDIQQFLILDRMVTDLNLPVEMVACPTVREPDGLAMSSRNRYLSADDRKRATVLYRALCAGRDLLHEEEFTAMVLQEAMTEIIMTEPDIEIDYLDIVDPAVLKEVAYIDDTIIMAGAIRVGSTRLIDNLVVHPVKGPWKDEV